VKTPKRPTPETLRIQELERKVEQLQKDLVAAFTQIPNVNRPRVMRGPVHCPSHIRIC
jgi:hypothetical protein